MRVLLEAGALEPREIGELCRLSSPSLAGVLARMEEIGLVTRRRLAHDQRRVRVSLTPRSRALAARMAPHIEAVYARVERQLGREFCEHLYAALDSVIDKLEPTGVPVIALPPRRWPPAVNPVVIPPVVIPPVVIPYGTRRRAVYIIRRGINDKDRDMNIKAVRFAAIAAIMAAATAAHAELSSEELAKIAQNPVGNLISVPFQENLNLNTGPYSKNQNVLNIQPVVPIDINEDWNIITRTILPVLSLPPLSPYQGRVNGIGDVQFTAFLSPAKPGSVIWGVGADHPAAHPQRSAARQQQQRLWPLVRGPALGQGRPLGVRVPGQQYLVLEQQHIALVQQRPACSRSSITTSRAACI